MTRMIRLLLGLGLFGLITSSISSALAFWGAWRFSRRRRAEHADFLPPVSLFKPLYGAEADLEARLATFFEQNYPRYEILFGARFASDAGLEAARRVASRYPQIPVKYVLTGEPRRTNAKACTLEAMERVASYDIFVVSDSDVRVTADYLREVVAPFADTKTGAVTCLYRGVAERGLWARLEAVGMSVEMTSGVLTANLVEGMKFMLGPTMAVRRAAVREMGGFGALGDYCADDFVLGNAIAANGHTVVLSTHVIDHVVLNSRFLDSQKHQVRWMKSTRFSRPRGHFGTSLTFAVPFGLLSALTLAAMRHPALGLALLAYSVGARMALAFAISSGVVRDRHALRATLLYPLRDLMGFCYWAASYAGSEIVWRSQAYRLSDGGLMLARDAAEDGGDEPVLAA